MLALTNWAYFSFCKEGIDTKSPMPPVKIAPDWGRTGVTGPFILAKNVKTTAALQQALGTFKNHLKTPEGGVQQPAGSARFYLSEHQVPVLLRLWRPGQMVLLWVCFFLSKVTQETRSSLSSPPACSHHVQGLCVRVCVRLFMCAHTVLVMGCPLGTVDADLQVTQWEWSCDGRCILMALQLVQRRATFNWASIMEPQRDRVCHCRRTVIGRSNLRIRGNETVLVAALLGLGRFSFRRSFSCYCIEETACETACDPG